jgi:hypothetical protein
MDCSDILLEHAALAECRGKRFIWKVLSIRGMNLKERLHDLVVYTVIGSAITFGCAGPLGTRHQSDLEAMGIPASYRKHNLENSQVKHHHQRKVGENREEFIRYDDRSQILIVRSSGLTTVLDDFDGNGLVDLIRSRGPKVPETRTYRTTRGDPKFTLPDYQMQSNMLKD